jgi:hypothetical protein
LLVRFHGAQQQFAVAGQLIEYVVMSDDLVLGFLQLHQLAKLRRLAGLALADNFGMGLKQAHDLARQLRHPFENPRLGLFHHLAHSHGHGR